MTGGSNGQSASGSTVAEYGCPYCRMRYPTELLVRAHVCHVEDQTHADSGLRPEVEVLELDAEGSEVGTSFTLPGRLTLGAIELSDVPRTHDGRRLAERERRALLVAAFNADRGLPYPELRDRVTAHLRERGLESLGVGHLRRLCEGFFTPDGAADEEIEAGDITTARTTLRDLTARQQAIVIAYAVRPDADEAELARRVNTASSYPEQVREARTDLLERVRIRLEHDGVERLLAERIPRENLETISGEGYLDEFDIDIGAAIERKHGDGPGSPPARIDRPARTAGDELPEGRADDTPGEASGDDRRHGAGHERSGSSGGASAGGDDPEHRGDHGGGEFDGSSLEVSSQDGVGESSGTGSGRTVDRREVAAVREQVAFDLAVLEREMELADPTPQQARTKACLERILERLDGVL